MMNTLAWNWDGRTLFLLELLIGFYALGVWKTWLRSRRGIGVGRGLAFVGSMAALFAALISPLDLLADALFSAHMAQHMILILIAAPLFMVSAFPTAFLWALPRRWSRALVLGWRRGHSIWRALTLPPVAWAIFAVTLWLWHFPALYEAALKDSTVHFAEHGAFLATAGLFWWVLIRPVARRQVQYGVNVLYLFTTTLQTGALGALLTFSSAPWYPTYASTSTALTPLGDQQLAGLIMWLPGGVLYVLLASGYFIAWLNATERAMQARLVRS
jgi:putative membrane protein